MAPRLRRRRRLPPAGRRLPSTRRRSSPWRAPAQRSRRRGSGGRRVSDRGRWHLQLPARRPALWRDRSPSRCGSGSAVRLQAAAARAGGRGRRASSGRPRSRPGPPPAAPFLCRSLPPRSRRAQAQRRSNRVLHPAPGSAPAPTRFRTPPWTAWRDSQPWGRTHGAQELTLLGQLSNFSVTYRVDPTTREMKELKSMPLLAIPHPRPYPIRIALFAMTVVALFLASGAMASQSSKQVVKEAENSTLGRTVLTTNSGHTLYSLSVETKGRFICTGSCLSAWTPLLVPKGVKPKGPVKLATVKRPNGKTQVTYKGRPLYSFNGDAGPDEANGEGLKDVGTWHAARVGSVSSSPAPEPESPYPY